MENYKPVTHVIFDMDGLLLDTERLYSEAIQTICSDYQKVYTWDLKVQLMGSKSEVGAQHIIDALQLPLTLEQYFDKINSEYDRLFPTSRIMEDTIDTYLMCHNNILAIYDERITREIIIIEMGRTAPEVAQSICSRFNLPVSSNDYLQAVGAQISAAFGCGCVQLMPGADRLVRHLHKNNIPMAIASGGGQESFELKTLKHKEFLNHFNHVVLATSDPEVKHGKPAPDVFLTCAARFPHQPMAEKCLVFEDAPNGVAAAVAASMQVVMVPDPRMSSQLTQGATHVISSLQDFKPELFGLPPFAE